MKLLFPHKHTELTCFVSVSRFDMFWFVFFPRLYPKYKSAPSGFALFYCTKGGDAERRLRKNSLARVTINRQLDSRARTHHFLISCVCFFPTSSFRI